MHSISPLLPRDKEALKLFTDQEIGEGYYSLSDLDDVLTRSQKKDVMCSYVLKNPVGAIAGVRFTYPPGQWSHGKGKGLKPELWPHAIEVTAYFQSLFISGSLQGQGWGGRLSEQSIQTLKEIGAKGIVCHSWKESPNDSSTRYLKKLGFEILAEHPLYWSEVDYNCTRCLKPPCQCTALEMYLNLEKL